MVEVFVGHHVEVDRPAAKAFIHVTEGLGQHPVFSARTAQDVANIDENAARDLGAGGWVAVRDEDEDGVAEQDVVSVDDEVAHPGASLRWRTLALSCSLAPPCCVL